MVIERERCGLVIQPGAIGDGLLTVPVVRLLLGELGLARVDMMGHREYLDVLSGRSEVGQVLSLEGAGLDRLFAEASSFDVPEGDRLIELFEPYEVVVSFLGEAGGDFERNLIHVIYISHAADVATLELRPQGDYGRHAGHFFMEQVVEQLAGWEMQVRDEFVCGPLVRPSSSDAQAGRRLLAEQGVEAERAVVLGVGSGSVQKCWPLRCFCELADMLAERGYQAVAVLGPAEADRWGEREVGELAGRMAVLEGLSLEAVAGVLSCCAGYVGNDSGISHLAGCAGGCDGGDFWAYGGEALAAAGGSGVAVCEGGSVGGQGGWPAVEEGGRRVGGGVERWWLKELGRGVWVILGLYIGGAGR